MRRVILWGAVALWAVGCDDGDGGREAPTDAVLDLDAVVDRGAPVTDAAGDEGAADAAVDAGADGAVDQGPPRPPAGERVAVDLSEALAPLPGGEGVAQLLVAERVEDLVDGPTTLGRVGDWVLQNDRVRFVVEADDRVIGPCPYGGNVIDADIRRAPGEPGADMVGELCLLLNLGQTLDPERYEVLADGSDGGAAVLAVTGRAALLDFINLSGIVSAFGPSFGFNLEIGYDIDRHLPVTISIYYILRPGDRGVRVFTAIRNDGDETLHLPVGHLIDSGGDVEVFNPLSPTGGFGNASLGAGALGGVMLPGVAFNGPGGGHGYVPAPDPRLDDPYPTSGRYLWVAGVVASLLGVDDLIGPLLATPPQIPRVRGILHMEPGAVELRSHWHFVGDGEVASLVDPMWAALGVETHALAGAVTLDGAPLAGVRVSALDEAGRAVNQGVSGDDGRYVMRVPAGRYTLAPWRAGHPLAGEPPAVEVAADVEAPALTMAPAGRLAVRITRPDGSPTPGRVTVECVGPCPQVPTATQRDVTTDGPLEGVAALVFTDVDGLADIALAPGSYRVTVTRGPAWSVWPPAAIPDGGEPVEVAGGAVIDVAAEIAPVLDDAGWLSGDFHVHGINSPDAPVALADRVRSFLGEGVDVLVSTDHDYITDYRPTIAALGADDELIGVTGIELTTFDYGHYNAFPLTRDPASRNGGALDWAGGDGPGLTPDQIFRGLEDGHPGEQVIQVNHPDSGYFGAIRADLLRGTSAADPTVYRLPPRAPDPVTGDTGLWSERFTAMEVMNGHGSGDFYGRLRWWLTLVGRGFTPTATGVSDTHRTIESQAGGPRSYVWVGRDRDTPATFDGAGFAAAVNAGRVIGSNGPLIGLRLVGEGGEATLGETLASTAGAAVAVEVEVQTPAWMTLETVDLYVNVVEPLLVDPVSYIEEQLPPTLTAALEPVEAAEIAAEGAVQHRRQRWRARFELTPERDAYVVAVVRGGRSLWPVTLGRGVRPLGFTNPVYVDVDGGGYDDPPLAALAGEKRARRPVALPTRPITLADLQWLWEALAHGH